MFDPKIKYPLSNLPAQSKTSIDVIDITDILPYVLFIIRQCQQSPAVCISLVCIDSQRCHRNGAFLGREIRKDEKLNSFVSADEGQYMGDSRITQALFTRIL